MSGASADESGLRTRDAGLIETIFNKRLSQLEASSGDLEKWR